jgi:probable F420-dependent oxidoreductase
MNQASALPVEIGRLGIFSIEFNPASVDFPSADPGRLVDAALEIEELGFSSLWVPGGPEGMEVLGIVRSVLGATDRLVVGTDILTIWTRAAQQMSAEVEQLNETAPGRFVLGLGASHANLVEPRGQKYEKPVDVMRSYLLALDATPVPVPRQRRMIAALGPRMLETARDHSGGALPYMVSPKHTELARHVLGSGPVLAPEQAVVFETDATRARAIGRKHLAGYLDKYVNYVNNFRRQGFTDEDFVGGGSDRLVDAIVAWGDLEAIDTRIREHYAAGADHVALQVLTDKDDPTMDPTRLPLEEWRRLSALVERHG